MLEKGITMNKIISLMLICLSLAATSCSESIPIEGLGAIDHAKSVTDLNKCYLQTLNSMHIELTSMDVCKEQLLKPIFYFDCEENAVRKYRLESVPSLVKPKDHIKIIWKAIDKHLETTNGYQNWISSMPKVLKTGNNIPQSRADVLNYVDTCPAI